MGAELELRLLRKWEIATCDHLLWWLSIITCVAGLENKVYATILI